MSSVRYQLDYEIQIQLEFQWCWAAVGVSCAVAYDPSLRITQCELARMCLPGGRNCCGDSIKRNGGNCAGCPGEDVGCDQTWFLQTDDHLGAFDLLDLKKGDPIIGAVGFDKLKAELDNGWLVSFLMIHPQRNFDHYVVVSGYEINGTQQKVIVKDSALRIPFPPMEYDKFKTNYLGRQARYTFYSRGKTALGEKSFMEVFSFPEYKITRKSIDYPLSPYKTIVTNSENLGNDNVEQIEQQYFNSDIIYFQQDDNRLNTVKAVKFGREIGEYKGRYDNLKIVKDISDSEHFFLIIEDVLVQAIWLRKMDRLDRANDIFIPMRPGFHDLVPGREYREEEFLQIVTRAAEKLKKT